MIDEFKVPSEEEEEAEAQRQAERTDLKDDYTFSRMTYYRLIKNGLDTLELMEELVKGSEHPRAFEVYGGLMGKISDIADKLLDMQRKNQILTEPEKKPGTVIPQQKEQKQIAFTGSASEIQQRLKQEREQAEKITEVKSDD